MVHSGGDVVAAQYEKWVYPLPIEDLEAFCADGTSDAVAPHIRHWQYWPDGRYPDHHKEAIDILVAGCGANAAARYAYQHPKARVVGIDLSSASLAHEEYLQKKHGLENLTLHQMRIEDIHQLGQEFDFIDSVGVLHHLPDPVLGLTRLRDVLRPHGVMGLMLYALYGRVGVYLLQDLFHRLGLEQTEEDLATVKETLGSLHPEFAGLHTLKKFEDLNYDAGIVDLFLHRIDRGYTVESCLEYVGECDLAFQGWINNYYYYPDGQIPLQLDIARMINALPEPDIWQAMELFSGRLVQHVFYVCKKERPRESYQLDLDGSAFLDYIPIRHIHHYLPADPARNKPASIQLMPFPQIPLNPRQEKLFSQVDDQSTVRQIMAQCGIEDTPESIERSARNFFKSLWRIGYLFFRIS